MTGLRGPVSDNGIEIVDSRKDRPIPAPPDDIHPDLLAEWDTYWSSSVALAADQVDLPMIRRLFTYRDEWLRLHVAYSALDPEDRIIAGSRNRDNLRIHPFADRMTKLESEISKLEDKLGLSPLARARLGIEIGNQKLTWQQLAKQASAGGSAEIANPMAGLPVAGVQTGDPSAASRDS